MSKRIEAVRGVYVKSRSLYGKEACPVCGEEITIQEANVRKHMNAHINAGEATVEDKHAWITALGHNKGKFQ